MNRSANSDPIRTPTLTHNTVAFCNKSAIMQALYDIEVALYSLSWPESAGIESAGCLLCACDVTSIPRCNWQWQLPKPATQTKQYKSRANGKSSAIAWRRQKEHQEVAKSAQQCSKHG